MTETTPEERALIVEGIEQWHNQRSPSGGLGGL